jgi:hypothetical protein
MIDLAELVKAAAQEAHVATQKRKPSTSKT